MKTMIVTLIVIFAKSVYGENISNIVEFFSFSCSHCYQSETMVKQAITKTSAQYVPVLIVQNINQQAVSSIYVACQLSGKGWQFRDAYFNAVFRDGYPEDSPLTVKYALDEIGVNSEKILALAQSQKVKDKLNFDLQMIQRYHVSSTPTFVINGSTILEGENALNSI